MSSANIGDAAAAADAAAMVMISTDKAIEPVSVLGASNASRKCTTRRSSRTWPDAPTVISAGCAC
jgi:FlaA1/EpsC-like NDP-sugar epimerase